MFKPVEVKVCGLTRASDVDLAIRLGVDYCGFIVFSKSLRGLSIKKAAELAHRAPIGKRVMVDVAPKLDVLFKARDLGFDYFQIHTDLDVSLSTLSAWASAVGKERLWLAPRIGPEDAFPEFFLNFADTILIDTFSKKQIGGTGETGDWGRFAQYKSIYPDTKFILAGGLTPQNIPDALAESGADHIDVNSGVESAPGIKDSAQLEALFSLFTDT